VQTTSMSNSYWNAIVCSSPNIIASKSSRKAINDENSALTVVKGDNYYTALFGLYIGTSYSTYYVDNVILNNFPTCLR
jgi:hypothetical protein